MSRRREKIHFADPWPRLPNGVADGPIIEASHGPAPWGARERRDGRRVFDHHVYAVLKLESSPTADLQRAITAYLAEHAREPRVFLALRYEVDGQGKILPPGRSSRLYRFLQACGVIIGEDETPLEEALERTLGWRLRVVVQLRETSRDRDPVTRQALPLPEAARFSVARHVIQAWPPGPPSGEHSAVSNEQGAVSNQQPGPPPVRVETGGEGIGAAVESVGRPVPGSQPTAPADAAGLPGSRHQAGADASGSVAPLIFRQVGKRRRVTTFSARRRGNPDRRLCWSCAACGLTNHAKQSTCIECDGPRTWA